MRDLRFAFRTLAANKSFSAVAILTLALGIGASTSIFSVVNTVLLRRLPFRDPDRLVMVWENNARGRKQNVVSPANFLDWNKQNTVFEELCFMAGFARPTPLAGTGEPEEIMSLPVGGNYFRLLGVSARLGRTFNDEESALNGPRVAVLSHAFWQRRFGGDPAAIGRPIVLSGQSIQIIGVMPPDFQPVGPKADIYQAASLDPAVNYRQRSGRFLLAFARLKPGATVERAQSEMSAIAKRLEQQYPEFNKNWGVNLVPMSEQFSQDMSLALKVLLGAVGFLLLIACANVANLQLARAASREREMGVRLSLGAGRWRLVRQLLAESLVVSVIAGALGCVLATWGVEAILAAAPKNVPLLDRVSVDWRVLGFAVGISLVVGILFGLAPALSATGSRLNESLKEGGRGSAGSVRGHLLRDTFVVMQVGLALLLLIGAGLTIRSFLKLTAVNPGFRADTIMTMRVSVPGRREDHRVVTFFREAVERMRALPGVKSASSITYLPFAGMGSATGWYDASKPKPGPGQSPVCDVRIIRPGYFQTMGIPLLRGRDFADSDTFEAPLRFIINETMARKHWPGQDPVGQRIIVAMQNENPPGEIIGVTGDIKHAGLDAEPREMVYYSHTHLTMSGMTFVLRTDREPEQITRAAIGVIRALDPEQPVADVRTMSSWIDESVTPARFRMMLLAVFSGVALLLAVVGIYGVVSYSVSQRTHELGVRLALGARPADILRLVLSRSTLLGVAGVAVGVAGAIALTRWMSTLLFEIKPTDALTYAVLSLVMIVAVVAAALAPARRATKVDPISALRAE